MNPRKPLIQDRDRVRPLDSERDRFLLPGAQLPEPEVRYRRGRLDMEPG